MEHRLPFTLTLSTQAPSPPTRLQPTDGAAGVALQPRLAWQPAAGETGQTYILELTTEPTFATLWLQVEDVSQTFYGISAPLPPATTSYWRVRAVNACGERDFSPMGHFTTRPLSGECPDGAAPQVFYNTTVAASAPDRSLQGNGNVWSIAGTRYHSSPYAFEAAALSQPATATLISPPISLPAAELRYLPLSLAFGCAMPWRERRPPVMMA